MGATYRSAHAGLQEPLLEKFTLAKACEKLEQSYGEWIGHNDRRSDGRTRSIQNLRAMQLARLTDVQDSKAGLPRAASRANRNWTIEDLNVLAAEMGTPMPDEKLSEAFYAKPSELLQHMRVESTQITKSSRVLSRLKGRNWQLTTLVRTFTAAEMHDLEFETAIPILAAAVSENYGFVPAQRLVLSGDDAIPRLLASCQSGNPTERLNAIRALQERSKTVPPELLETLLRDESPRVRLHAARCAGSNWDARFTQPLMGLLRDPHTEIRQQVIICFSDRESTNRTSIYLGLLNDSEPQVRTAAPATTIAVVRVG
ncbi:MAG: HEAT repeat domain-containing protein [Verrucomicrobiae bacterium]|nr:HEAT repeat domain-containing protein [Verrucomicrobiae bacterium]